MGKSKGAGREDGVASGCTKKGRSKQRPYDGQNR